VRSECTLYPIGLTHFLIDQISHLIGKSSRMFFSQLELTVARFNEK